MGNQPTKPSEKDAEDLQRNFSRSCARAGKLISESDVLLLCTGAGFSADSGLAVYADIAKIQAYSDRTLSYPDICQPHWLETEPQLFFGFWGGCFNDYRQTQPHEGYELIAQWRNLKNKTEAAKRIRQAIAKTRAEAATGSTPIVEEPYTVSGTAGAFFSFTSNVDAHMFDFFPPEEVRECHGNVELWQCSAPCCQQIWRAPAEFLFHVDPETMLAPAFSVPGEAASPALGIDDAAAASFQECDETKACIGRPLGISRLKTLRYMPTATNPERWVMNESEEATNAKGLQENDDDRTCSNSGNHPTCGQCKAPARPAILMFGDSAWIDTEEQSARWEEWSEAVLQLSIPDSDTKPPLKVCILEVGCGGNVITVRANTERIYKQVTSSGGNCTVVRINPELPLADNDEYQTDFVSIMSKGLPALKEIDRFIPRKSKS
ncbi:hypothetical protein CYMTET_6267 [Cymbomonas tetramitiformis]|uniref:Deacetylase sirtuin-type domain-containing protein n=1 Tax=Cymbomonas tetramitiformis TaxID=36881 RepID=A0AAE0GXH0_9CHLO|nr:hypothetical protein CYMTET_6267 [Cymbomonas tetramitiformis]